MVAAIELSTALKPKLILPADITFTLVKPS